MTTNNLFVICTICMGFNVIDFIEEIEPMNLTVWKIIYRRLHKRNNMIITYDLTPTPIHNAQVESKEGSMRVILRIFTDDRETTLDMSYTSAERLWHALKGCVDLAVKAYE